jgi:hypothetical protein
LARRRRRQDNEEKLKKTNLRGYCQIKSNSGQLKGIWKSSSFICAL